MTLLYNHISSNHAPRFIYMYLLSACAADQTAIMYNNYIIELLPERKIAFVKGPEPNLGPQFFPLFPTFFKILLDGFSMRIMVWRCGRPKCSPLSWKNRAEKSAETSGQKLSQQIFFDIPSEMCRNQSVVA